jgi:hypothetical protein
MAIPETIDVEDVISVLASSNGDIFLSAERLAKKYDVKVTDYDVEAFIVGLDTPTADRLSAKLRTLLVVKLYNLIHAANMSLLGAMDDLRPSELARAHSSLVTSFTALTAPSVKTPFDFVGEVAKLAEELEIPVEEAIAEIKKYTTKTGSGLTSRN